MTPDQVISSLSILTLISNIVLVAFAIVWILRNTPVIYPLWEKLLSFLKPNLVAFSAIVALVATVSSLYFSEVALFAPCKFCWLQRIFMYPLPIILGVGLLNKSKEIWQYVLPLSVIGFFLGAYHYIIQVSPNPYVPCTTIGFSLSCSDRFFTHFGYITIPWMSLSAFLLITIAMLLVMQYTYASTKKGGK